MGRSSAQSQSVSRLRLARGAALLAFAAGCSGGLVGSTHSDDGPRRGPASARAPAGKAAATANVGRAPFDSSGEVAPPPLDPSAAPILTAELQRLRRAAEVRVLGREAHDELHATPTDSPADASVTTADEPASASPALGRFVTIENEVALEHFHKALARLAAGNDEDGKVRILAYGASHTQADTYTGYLRAYLQSRFGDGGHGFVMLGRVNRWYGTADARVHHRRLTIHHARYRTDVYDEPLGLFGAAAVGQYGGSFGEIVTAKNSPNTRFELQYFKQPHGGDFSVQVDGRNVARIQTNADAPGIGYCAFEAQAGRRRIRAQLRGNGPVRLFGVSAETANPGVVIDTLGIGGSQITSSLRWNEQTWIEAVRHRNPDLVTFAYGTNEAMDTDYPLASYERDLRAVLARLRKALPEVSCVLLSPFDVPAHVNGRWTTNPRLMTIIEAQRRISKELGCGFWDGYAFMGGRGSMHRWVMYRPPLASSDHVHLTRRGYVYAGMALGDALMRTYDLEAVQMQERAALAEPFGAR
jgi:lysophospholipase L1-like esterase